MKKEKHPKVSPEVKIKTQVEEEHKKSSDRSTKPEWTHPLPRPTIFDSTSIV